MLLACAPYSRLLAQSQPQSQVTEQYIDQYKGIAEQEMARTGVPAAVSLAQGILESQSGTGWLVLHSHNHFGVKCKNDWTGPTIGYDDDRKNECFRVYRTDDSSWRDHSDFLASNPRYAFLFYLDPSDYKAWAMGLKKAGYATDKRYAERLIQTIETYHLEQYTDRVLAMGKGAPAGSFADILDRKVNADRRAMGLPGTPPPADSDVEDTSPVSPYPAGTFSVNGRRVIYLPSGTQLITVAEKYHIRLSRLVSYNDLHTDVLPAGMLVFLQRKAKTGAHAMHRLASGETLQTVSQEEGMQLKWLCRFNGLSASDAPPSGTLLYLQGDAPQESAQPKKRGFLARLFSKDRPAAAPASAVTAQAPRDPATEVPAKDPPTVPGQPAQPAQPAAAQAGTYEVKKGDTLYGISRKYDVPVTSIRAWNHLENDQIKVGQKLIVETNH